MRVRRCKRLRVERLAPTWPGDWRKSLTLSCSRRQRGLFASQVEPRTWEAYRLTAEEGLSGIEAATRLGMGAGAVYQAKSAVLRRLHEEVRDLEHGPRAVKST